MRAIVVAALGMAFSQWAMADAVVLEKDGAATHRHAKAGSVKAGDKRSGVRVGSSPAATGSVALIDASGMKYFINTNITFSTSSSASAAMSEASYTHAVAATTLNGGTVSSTLNDSYDGYNTLCVSLTNASGTCQTGNAAFTIYNKNGAGTTLINGGREVQFPNQTIGNLVVNRRVFVPTNDSFARWINSFTNNGAAPVTFTATIGNNLGSDSNTTIVTTSSGDAVATTGDLWVTTFQNYNGNTTSDPRLMHVLQGAGAATPLSAINFANGDDNPFWSYSITLNPGQTKTVVNFSGGFPSKAAAAAKAAQLATFAAYPNAIAGMSSLDLSQVTNFVSIVPVVPATGLSAKALLAGLLALVAVALLARRQGASGA